MNSQTTKSEKTLGFIDSRAALALPTIAMEFGTVLSHDGLEVRVKPHAGSLDVITLRLTQGNFIWSRVYDLEIEYSSSGRGRNLDVKFTKGKAIIHPRKNASSTEQLHASTAQSALSPLMDAVDLKSMTMRTDGATRTTKITPLGGAYLWILLPPISYWVRFPQGEPARLLSLLEAADSASAAEREMQPGV